MSKASTRVHARTGHRIDRLQPWIAALLTALLHFLLLLIAVLSPPITMTTPQGTAAGSTVVQVDFIDGTPPPSLQAPSDSAPAEMPPAASRLHSTPVARADDPLPPDAAIAPDTPTASRIPRPVQRPNPPTPPASTPPTTQQRSRTRGQPPGMLQENHAPVNAGPAPSPAVERGRRYRASASEPNLEVGGYQVIYDLHSERRLRAWRDQGMTELFLPLPGTQQYMICPLETALKRESGPCRLLDPDDPEMANIGDAREVLNMQQVYRRGELVWRGPGPYR